MNKRAAETLRKIGRSRYGTRRKKKGEHTSGRLMRGGTEIMETWHGKR